MPTLRRIWVELLISLWGLALLVVGAGMVSPHPPVVRARHAEFQPVWAASNLLDHARAFAIREGGYPQSFAPIQEFFIRLDLRKAPAYWRCMKSIPMAAIERELDFPLGHFSPSLEDQTLLAQSLGPRFLHEPGDFVYIPARELPLPPDLEDRSRRYAEMVVVLYRYSVTPVERLDSQDLWDYGSGVRSQRVGPYEVITPRQPLPELFLQRRIQFENQTVQLRQRGSQITLSITPSTNSVVPQPSPRITPEGSPPAR